jgi:hypothetical protein
MKRNLQLYYNLRILLVIWNLINIGLFILSLFIDKNNIIPLLYAIVSIVVFAICDIILNDLR